MRVDALDKIPDFVRAVEHAGVFRELVLEIGESGDVGVGICRHREQNGTVTAGWGRSWSAWQIN
jgi:hypothetical protein